ncbi:MAG: hypothetical protein WAS33_25530, partial [Candidatus Promineifilaceae bacterium]
GLGPGRWPKPRNFATIFTPPALPHRWQTKLFVLPFGRGAWCKGLAFGWRCGQSPRPYRNPFTNNQLPITNYQLMLRTHSGKDFKSLQGNWFITREKLDF